MRRLCRIILCGAVMILLSSPCFASIDVEVKAALDSSQVEPSPMVSDELFVRRTYLVVAGRLPSLEESLVFLNSKSKKRRAELVDLLLSSDDFVDMLTLKWGDLLKVKSEFPSNIWPNGVQAYNRWIRVHMRENTPYDKFVRDLLLCSGSNFRRAQVSFYRAFVQRTPELIVENVELLFLGRRESQPEAAQFFEQVRYKNTTEWKEEIVYVDIDLAPSTTRTVTMSLDGREVVIEPKSDLREDYVEWLTSSDNRHFARAMANRIWYWTMGRGVVDAPDDFRADNPASNPKLLEYITDSFIASKYDVRALYREILLSETYQRSSMPTEQNRERGAELFAYYPTTRLTAEQLIDGISQITGINDRYVSRVPEPYSYYPADLYSHEIGDATVSSDQLDLFGRPSRDNSLESHRNNSVNSKQTLYLLNSNSITSKISQSKRLKSIIEGCESSSDLVDTIYVMMLARYPSSQEREMMVATLDRYPKKQEGAEELIWALINSSEFIFNH